MPIVLKSGRVNLLEPSGPVQVCNGIALTFTVFTENKICVKTNKQTNELGITSPLTSDTWHQHPKEILFLLHVNVLRLLEEAIPYILYHSFCIGMGFGFVCSAAIQIQTDICRTAIRATVQGLMASLPE